MELNFSTFLLEIVNFLALIWILKRFLYKPVLDVIAQRRAGIEERFTESQRLHDEAEKLKAEYENRLADWGHERQQARDKLMQELNEERTQQMTALQTALGAEQQKAQVAEARHQADIRHKMEETALVHGARFATRLLEQASGPDTESRLVELVIRELMHLPAEHITALRNNYKKIPDAAVVVSAFPLADSQRQRLEQALTTITRPGTPVRFEQDTELMAGLHITIGAWVLAANLRDELRGFMELANVE